MDYWQVAAGKGARDYSDIFLNYGVMLIAGGDRGDYFKNKAEYSNPNKENYGIVDFAEGVEKEDSVILKRKHNRDEWEILAVGKVVGDYEHLEQFDDVKGWDLQHCRKVQWVLPPVIQNDPLERKKIITKGLRRCTFMRSYNNDAIGNAEGLRENGEIQEAVVIPDSVPPISYEDLRASLIGNGLDPANSEGIIEAIKRISDLASWYKRHDEDENQSEHETRTFLILPIMQALGWSEQRIKIEWEKTGSKKIDTTFFQEDYSKGSNPCMILEAKKRGGGLDDAPGQAGGYAEKYPQCSRLVVSDGICYYLFEKDDTDWILKAYMNLLKLKNRYPYEQDIEGAAYLFNNLMPK